MSSETLRLVKVIEPYGEFPVTTLTIWNKIAKGLVIAGYGSGHLRLFSIPGKYIMPDPSVGPKKIWTEPKLLGHGSKSQIL